MLADFEEFYAKFRINLILWLKAKIFKMGFIYKLITWPVRRLQQYPFSALLYTVNPQFVVT